MRFQGTATYVAGDELKTAVNAAIALERPLLVKGEPGTGKTLLAQEIAGALGAPFIAWHIKSTTRAQQGLYEYDAVSRLRDSQLGDPRVSDIANYIRRGKLWEAFASPARPVLLIDEIDKADIEFPNDLLLELDQMEFHVYETGETVKARLRPIVIITSNNEKELPDAFLRRCFFHYIRFPDAETMRRIVESHYPSIKPRLVEEAMRSFFALREMPGLKKKPTTSELLDWLKLLLNEDISPDDLARARRQEADPSPARRAAQERAGRASVREARLPEPAGAVGDGRPLFLHGVTTVPPAGAGRRRAMRAKSVLISGAGIAGPALAYLAQRRRFQNHDCRTGAGACAPADTSSTSGASVTTSPSAWGSRTTSGASGTICESFGSSNARANALAGFGTRVFRELTGGRFVTLARSDLARLLFETVRGETEVLFGDEIAGLEQRTDCVRRRNLSAPARARSTSSSAPTACIRTFAGSPSARSHSLKRISAMSSRRSRPEAIGRGTKTPTSSTASPAAWSGASPCATTGRSSCSSSPGTTNPCRRRSTSRAQRAMLRQRLRRRRLGMRRRFSSVSMARRTSISIGSRRSKCLPGRAAASRWSAMRRFCVSLMAGQGSALSIGRGLRAGRRARQSRRTARRSVREL